MREVRGTPVTAPPEQLAYEAYQAARWPYGEAGSIPWTHPALGKARTAWKAAVAAGVEASPDLITARNALSDLAELHLRTVQELAAVTAEAKRYRNWLDDFTRLALDLGDRPGLSRAAGRFRSIAGLPS